MREGGRPDPPRAVLAPDREHPFLAGHPWVFSGAVARVAGDPADGDEVAVETHDGAFVAWGLFNSRSQIRVRLYSWDRDRRLDAGFWEERVRAAVELRRRLGLDDPDGGCRLVHSDADGLSGLVADRYGEWLVVQFTGLALGARRELLVDALLRHVPARGVYLRTERGIGREEGLEAKDGPLRGAVPEGPVTIVEEGLRFEVDVRTGQKTGFYLDQRENRRAAARYAAGRRALDLCCYTGAFSLALARAGATDVLGVDVSQAAVRGARRNAELNGPGNVRFEVGDAFRTLEDLAEAGERFDLVVLDPPRFARSRRGLRSALRGYASLNELAVRVLAPGGILVTCSCSGRVSREAFAGVLAGVGERAGRRIRFLEQRGQAPDHPVAPACPETGYLKCFVCHVE